MSLIVSARARDQSMSLVIKSLRLVFQHKKKGLCLGVVGFLTLRYVYIVWKRRKNREPPGPIGLPIIGAAHLRGTKGDFGTRMACKYGPICQLKMGPTRIYLLNHSQLVKQVIIDENVIDRPRASNNNNFNVLLTDTNTVSLAVLNGKEWKHRRRLALSLLTNVPRNKLESIINDALSNVLFPYFDKLNLKNGDDCNNNEWHIRDELVWYAFNTLYTYNVGNIILDMNDKFVQNYISSTKKAFSLSMTQIWYNIFPFLRNFSSFNKYVNNRIVRTNFIRQLIDRRIQFKKNKNNNNNSDDETTKNNKIYNNNTYIDQMLLEEEEGNISRNEMIADVDILFSAGTETTSSTLEIGVLLLAKYPKMQEKMRNILLHLWQKNGSPMMNGGNNNNNGNTSNYKQYSLKWKLDSETKEYSNQFIAFIYEILRISTTAARGVVHFTSNKSFNLNVLKEYGTRDNKNHIYHVPKNTVIVYNSEYIHKYSKYEKEWKHKEYNINDKQNDQICLENWLEIDVNSGKSKLLKQTSLPYVLFGIGKRDCVGKRLAENEIEMFIASLILNYRVQFNCQKYGNNPNDVQINVVRAVTAKVVPRLTVQVKKI